MRRIHRGKSIFLAAFLLPVNPIVAYAGICVLPMATGFSEVGDVLFQVKFRQLSDAQLGHYLQVEQPYQCAGALNLNAKFTLCKNISGFSNGCCE